MNGLKSGLRIYSGQEFTTFEVDALAERHASFAREAMGSWVLVIYY